MHQQRVRIHADRKRLGIKNRPVGRSRKSKPTESTSIELCRAYSPIVALLAELALTHKPPPIADTPPPDDRQA
jgi:hypothetical protein